MSQINLKSITGITSINTPAGVDNVFTVHSNDTTERFRVDSNGNQVIAGILTVAQDLDVDGHTNLDNVSVAGVTTMGQTTIAHTSAPQLIIKDSDTTERFRVDLNGNQRIAGILTVAQDLDVDGHTNLDNVSIAGVVTATTFSGSGANLTALNASNISSGTVPTARLGSGTASSSKFLR